MIEKYEGQPAYKTSEEIFGALQAARRVEVAIRKLYDAAELNLQGKDSQALAEIVGDAVFVEEALQQLHASAEATES